MAINRLIAKKYALAAFNLAKKLNLIDQFSADLKKFADAFSHSIAEELANPAISRPDLAKIAQQLGQNFSLHSQVINFLQTIASARRISNIKIIEQNFAKLVKIEKNILDVELVCASQLDDQTYQEVKDFLQKKYPQNSLEITQTVKKDILGGLIIKIGSNLIDASLKSQLSSLKNTLDQQFQLAL